MRRLFSLLLVAAACRPANDPPADEAAPAVADAGPQQDARDQYALLAAIEATLQDPLSRDASAMATVRADWQGHRYRWEVAFVPLFCRSPEACHVGPFDHAKFGERRIQQGWMPQLELDAAGLADLEQRCAAHRVCIVEMEATLREFVFDPDFATALRFSDVRVLATRAAGDAESWMRSRATLRPRV